MVLVVMTAAAAPSSAALNDGGSCGGSWLGFRYEVPDSDSRFFIRFGLRLSSGFRFKRGSGMVQRDGSNLGSGLSLLWCGFMTVEVVLGFMFVSKRQVRSTLVNGSVDSVKLSQL
ncbi:hypothetical protein Hanom_Chr09g00764641 [Helianthus anomalus]